MTDDATLERLRYPIGRFEMPATITETDCRAFLSRIEATPARLREEVAGLGETQFDTPYRPGGWTVRQVVHHLVDSHLNSYLRFKWALTEEAPAIKVYDEAAWAELEDARTAPAELSLAFLEALHARWVYLLTRLSAEDLGRTFKHPDWGTVRLDMALAIYAWHGDHHVAHIAALRERQGW